MLPVLLSNEIAMVFLQYVLLCRAVGRGIWAHFMPDGRLGRRWRSLKEHKSAKDMLLCLMERAESLSQLVFCNIISFAPPDNSFYYVNYYKEKLLPGQAHTAYVQTTRRVRIKGSTCRRQP
jgi:hypothetical protein